MAAIGTIILFAPLRALILRKENSYKLALRYWPLFVFIVAFIMCIFLIIKGLKRLDFDYETEIGLAMLVTVKYLYIVTLWYKLRTNGLLICDIYFLDWYSSGISINKLFCIHIFWCS